MAPHVKVGLQQRPGYPTNTTTCHPFFALGTGFTHCLKQNAISKPVRIVEGPAPLLSFPAQSHLGEDSQDSSTSTSLQRHLLSNY